MWNRDDYTRAGVLRHAARCKIGDRGAVVYQDPINLQSQKFYFAYSGPGAGRQYPIELQATDLEAALDEGTAYIQDALNKEYRSLDRIRKIVGDELSARLYRSDNS